VKKMALQSSLSNCSNFLRNYLRVILNRFLEEADFG
jgi:hypothetical protein